jgi:hypothetical protein
MDKNEPLAVLAILQWCMGEPFTGALKQCLKQCNGSDLLNFTSASNRPWLARRTRDIRAAQSFAMPVPSLLRQRSRALALACNAVKVGGTFLDLFAC